MSDPQPLNGEQAKTYGFLDLLVTLAEAHRLLIAGPLIAGILVFGITWGLPETYQFKVTAILLDDSVGLLNDSAFDGQVAATLGIPMSGAELASRIKVSGVEAGRKIALRWEHSESGEDVLRAVLQRVHDTVDARLIGRLKKINDNIDITLNQITLIENWSKMLSKKKAEIEQIETSSNMLGILQTQEWIIKRRAEQTAQLNQLRQELEMVRQDGAIISVPTVSVDVIRTAKSNEMRVLPYLAALGALMVLLVFVFVRQSFRSLRQDPSNVQKLGRIRRAFFGDR